MIFGETGSPGRDTDQALFASDIINLEAVYLDERRWDDWLSLFSEDCEYWVPTWVNDDTQSQDPQLEISHIYYKARAALEDRIVRIKSKLSPASAPLPRTTHILGSIRPLATPSSESVIFRTPWVSHVFWPTTGDSVSYFGSYEHTLVLDDGKWLIARKKIVLQNDYIPTVVDIYCL